MRVWPRLPASWQIPLAALAVSLVCAWAFWLPVAKQAERAHGNYSHFLQISEITFDADPLVNTKDDLRASLILLNPGGYDGQFMFFLALDPLMSKLSIQEYRDVFDEPAYRYGRIGFSWLVAAVGVGHWSQYPAVMMWVLIASVCCGAFALASLAQTHSRSAAWGLLFLLVPAFWQSVFSALPESLAAAFMIIGYLLWTRGHVKTAAAVLAYAMLVRETAVIFVLCLIVAAWRSTSWRRDRVLLFALVPLVLWRGYVYGSFMPVYGWSVFTRASQVFGLPFAGAAHALSLVQHGHYFHGDPNLVRSAIALSALEAFGLVVSAMLLIKRRDPIAVSALLYSCLAVSFNYQKVWVHAGNAQRVTYEMFVMLALAAAVTPASKTLGRVLTAFWVMASAFVFFGAYDAGKARDALPGLLGCAAVWLGFRSLRHVLQVDRS